MLPFFYFKGVLSKLNYNERQLEQAGYDRWKLSAGDERDTVIKSVAQIINVADTVRKMFGTCPCCKKEVLDNQMFEETEVNIYHFSCYHQMFAKGEVHE
ncbi:hypothetical protein CN981_09410 [Priestia megaterium]|nr:hypothetical protein CN981_09410 [Priestia megaterium]